MDISFIGLELIEDSTHRRIEHMIEVLEQEWRHKETTYVEVVITRAGFTNVLNLELRVNNEHMIEVVVDQQDIYGTVVGAVTAIMNID